MEWQIQNVSEYLAEDSFSLVGCRIYGQGQSSHGNINGTVALGLTDGRIAQVSDPLKWGQSSRINTLITYC
jgi:hypothetical protein